MATCPRPPLSCDFPFHMDQMALFISDERKSPSSSRAHAYVMSVLEYSVPPGAITSRNQGRGDKFRKFFRRFACSFDVGYCKNHCHLYRQASRESLHGRTHWHRGVRKQPERKPELAFRTCNDKDTSRWCSLPVYGMIWSLQSFIGKFE